MFERAIPYSITYPKKDSKSINFRTFFLQEHVRNVALMNGATMKFVISPAHHERLVNERNIVPAGTLDLTYIVTIIQKYRDECDQSDPYVHSSFVSRVTDIVAFFREIRRNALDENDSLCCDIAIALVAASLERNTNFEQHQPTPSEAVYAIFNDAFLETLWEELGSVPFHVFAENPAEGIVDLLAATRLVMRMCPNNWVSEEETERCHDDRIDGKTFQIELIDEAELVGEEYVISAFDEWAEGQSFPWDGENSNL